MTLRDGESYRSLRKVYVPTDEEGFDRFRMFASRRPGRVAIGRDDRRADSYWFHTYEVPPEALAAFEAGEDPLPLIDWLLERHPELDWITAALAPGPP